LIKAIFDVDKMLYFVAPEWWQPRRHAGLDVGADRTTSPLLESLTRGSLAVVQKDSSIKKVAEELVAKKRLGTLGSEDIVGWGGEGRRDNYLITDDSAPAKLGSSLGWLLQLDGDNLRNAFLNAPWVKAVIPVRPGREKEALEWLKQSQVEGTEGLSERYAGDDDLLLRRRYAEQHNLAAIPASITIDQAIEVVATDVAQKFKKSNIVTKEVVEVTPGQEEDIFYLPPDEVFEKGFRPLVGGFQATLDEEADKRHFKIFDQWIELLPTDQIVAVKVKYNADGVQVPIDDDHEADDDDT
jgi:hypothetical protein